MWHVRGIFPQDASLAELPFSVEDSQPHPGGDASPLHNGSSSADVCFFYCAMVLQCFALFGIEPAQA